LPVILIIGLVAGVILVQQKQLFRKRAANFPATSLYYIHSDNLGSTSMVTDDTGTVVSRQTYYPYGTTRSEEGDSPTERQYTGQISDSDQTGLYYYNARYYNPQIAKFTQADSSNDQLNRYAYVNNNPINSTDPTGRQDCNPNTAGGNAYPPWHPCAWVLIGEELKGYWNKAQEMAVAWVNNPIEFNKNLGKAIVQTAPQVIVYAIVANSQLGPQAAEALDTTLCALAADPGLCMISAQASGPNVATKFDVDDVPGRAGFLQSSQLVEKEMDPTGKLMMVGREELFDQYGLRYANGLHDPNGITLRATGDFSQMNVTLHHEYLHEIYGRGVGQYQSLNEMVENEIWVRETMLGYKGYGCGWDRKLWSAEISTFRQMLDSEGAARTWLNYTGGSWWSNVYQNMGWTHQTVNRVKKWLME